MIINPKQVIDQGIITWKPEIKIENHLQQNGIDIDVDTLFISVGSLVLCNDVSIKPVHLPVPLEENKTWECKTGKAYVFESSFEINVPENMSGFLRTRSTLNRNQIHVESGWYDSGYKGPIGGTIYCFNNFVFSKNTRVAQLILMSSEAASLYKGQYSNQC